MNTDKHRLLERPKPTSGRSAAQRAVAHKAHPTSAGGGTGTGAPFEEEPAQLRRIAQWGASANTDVAKVKKDAF